MPKSSNNNRSELATSQSLLVRLRGNDKRAWNDVIDLYAPLVHYWCRRSGLPHQECADVIQDVFRAMFASLGSFRKEAAKDSFRAWLRTITRSKVADYFRQSQRQPRGDGGTEAAARLQAVPAWEDDVDTDEKELCAEQRLFQRAMEMIRVDFQPKTWAAFYQTVVEGRETSEVADELGMKPGAVRVAKSRVLKRLRNQLGDLWE